MSAGKKFKLYFSSILAGTMLRSTAIAGNVSQVYLVADLKAQNFQISNNLNKKHKWNKKHEPRN